MIYLVEFEAFDPHPEVNAVVVERLATDGYTTGPNDNPPHRHYEGRVINPGNFEQSIFDDGTTSGEARVGYGFIEVAIGDDGAGENLDRLARYAVDGRRVTIWALEGVDAPFTSRALVLTGIMEQIEVSWTVATIRIRDRLDDLRVPLQTETYKGTTTDGTKTDAEGTPEDLKDKPKPLAWGVNRNVPGIVSNRFKLVFDFASNGCEFDEVRDDGVPLTKGASYSTLAALMAATIPERAYGRCSSTGQIRIGDNPKGAITADITEGASGARSIGKVVRRMLGASGFDAGADYNADELDALHALNGAEVGIWIGADSRNVLPAVTAVLASMGAWICPDATGVFRFGQVDITAGAGGPVLDLSVILDRGQGIERIVTNDAQAGVPAWKVTVSYAPAWLVQSEADLNKTAATAALKAFATRETRSASAENEALKTIHLRASELTFASLFASEAAAKTEAGRQLALRGQRRQRYRVPLKDEVAIGIRLGSIVTLQLPRFDLDAGRPMLVIGKEVVLPRRSGDKVEAGVITLDIYG